MTTGTPPPNARPARRSRLRTFLPLGIAAWLVLEIWLLTVVASAAGGLTVFLLLLAGVVLGSVVIKRAGRRAFKTLSEQLQQAQSGVPPTAPERGTGNGLTMLGGLLLMLPGLISDALGLLCLLPPVRKVVGKYSQRTFERKLSTATPGASRTPSSRRASTARTARSSRARSSARTPHSPVRSRARARR